VGVLGNHGDDEPGDGVPTGDEWALRNGDGIESRADWLVAACEEAYSGAAVV
jgi:hypothetical protein